MRERRGELLGALLTIARAWFVAGKPEGTAEPLGSFESWTRAVGGILENADIRGFLQNLDSLYQEADPAQLQWEAFLLALADSFEMKGFTIKELVDQLPGDPELNQALPDELADEDRKGSLQRRPGRAFSERVGRRYGPGGLHLKKAGANRNKVALWRILGQECQLAALRNSKVNL